MSEYQYVAFRAIDGPVSEANLEYMRTQSSRAEITPWSFENEYHYGDFRGNAMEMLRRGYDLHLHYANFGIRNLFIRFPHGLPSAEAAKPYFIDRQLRFLKDKQGRGGTLCIAPFYEPGALEELWDVQEFIDRLIPLRAEILDGDLRPLYLAHLAIACDCEHDPDETTEGPVPAGLNELTDAQRALTELYGMSDALIAAAAQASQPLPSQPQTTREYADWIRRQPQVDKDAWLVSLMGDQPTVRAEILAEYRKSRSEPTWPTVRLDRTIADFLAAADSIQLEATRKADENAARERAKRLANMAADPSNTLLETERLVKERRLKAYAQVGKLLAELREALAGTDHAGLAEQQASNLQRNHPTLRGLVSELRQNGLLPK